MHLNFFYKIFISLSVHLYTFCLGLKGDMGDPGPIGENGDPGKRF